MMLCASCGASIPPGARFCSSCGAPAPQAQQEERRIVTVLFADLVGFTALSEYMDPEQVKRLVDSCFECLVEVVSEFGGRVDKLLGDGMLVLFGAPVAHEDDPERAVRAALRMQEVLSAHTEQSGLVGSDGIRMRVGINTGEVLVGTLAGTDYTAMGDVVNTAQRLQAAAPPGGVYVGGSTHALTVHTVAYEPAGELQAKGREQTVVAWLAQAALAPPGARRRRRRDVPTVGRDREMALAASAIEFTVAQQRALALNVSGESGVGKTRVIDDVIRGIRAMPGSAVLEGACVPYGEANVWFPIASALTRYLDLEPGQALVTVREVAATRARALFGEQLSQVDRLVDVFTHLMGHPSPIDRLEAGAARSTIHHAVAAVLEARTAEGPVVLSIDDLHWADPDLVSLLEHLATSLSRRPFALLTAMRPGSDIEWPPRAERTTVVSLTLQPLSRHDTAELTRSLLDDTSDERLIDALYDRSGGNPLFLLELAALTEAGGGHRELPDSLRSLIAARLDQLTPDQRQIIENAAVLGTSGTVVSLSMFAAELGQRFSQGLLAELDDLGLLHVERTRWEFRSDSVREAAYQTLTKAARAQRHAGVAKALMHAPVGIDDRAHHAATAAELLQELGPVDKVPTSITGWAVELLSTAAEKALDGGSFRTASRHATRAIDLAPAAGTAPASVAQLRLVRATSLIEQRQFDLAAADIEAMASLGTELADNIVVAEAHRLRGMLANVAGRIDEARAELGVAVDMLRQVDRPDLLARALRLRGFIEMFGGSLVDAEWFFGEADDLYRGLADERGMAYIEQHRAWITFLSGDLPAARERLTHAAATLHELGDRNGEGWANGLLAFVEFLDRNFDTAEQLARVVTAEANQRGDEWAAGMMDTLMADLRLWQGQLEEALGHAEKARARFKRLNDRFGLVQALAPLVRTQVALGKNAAAQRSAEELLTIAETGRQGVFPLLAAAGAAMHRGLGVVATAMAERAISELAATGGRAWEPHVVLAIGLAQQGDVDGALAALDRVPSDGAGHPFHHAGSALVHAVSGGPSAAIEHAQTTTATEGATYLDQVFAYVAAAGASAQLGQHQQAELAAQAAVAQAVAVGDVVATALATRVYAAVTGKQHAAHDEHTQLGEGWATVVQLLAPEVLTS